MKSEFLGIQVPLDLVKVIQEEIDQIQKNDTKVHQSTTTTTTTNEELKEEEEGGKKKKKNNARTGRGKLNKTLIVEPGSVLAGINDEQDYIYDYGNVITVKGVDISKPWTEEKLGKYLKDAGFVKGSANTASNKAEMTPFYLQFSNRVVSIILSHQGKFDQFKNMTLTGNGSTDFNNAFSSIATEAFERMRTNLPPSYGFITALLVVGAYQMGVSGFGRGSLPNIVKHSLVERNKEIPRDLPELYTKLNYTFNIYHCIVDQQYKVVWDKTKMTEYLQKNGVRQFRTNRYQRTKHINDNIIDLCKLVMNLIFRNTKSKEPVPRMDTVESAIDKMGRLAHRHWNSKEQWIHQMILYVVLISLIAFQAGIQDYIYTPLIDGCVKREILNNLEYPSYDFGDDPEKICDYIYAKLYVDD
ncbi:hypothetical protein DFA_11206 [Cavenderia fasciculata]|uniref:Uncharacterized protein n=1 Tax=Cavenderia fasciculata TaxID=261658 RepID=F4QFD8_CACFS|nr:uncharacterized protein DFA_11206 [Cavenderia fasciculata]EGG13445.1 hypothetical protein DFA_11206 [Cavenderia fasciculata]|eukprot:XP_004350149.1 hypothetical protein DFA_11206 [Cavenderia fasciculata]